MNAQEQRRQTRKARRPTAYWRDLPIDAGVLQVSSADASGERDSQSRIATAAYFRAEKRGFEPGHELDDWLAAEAEIMNIQVSIGSPTKAAGPEGSS
jgi:hypothetical protein